MLVSHRNMISVYDMGARNVERLEEGKKKRRWLQTIPLSDTIRTMFIKKYDKEERENKMKLLTKDMGDFFHR